MLAVILVVVYSIQYDEQFISVATTGVLVALESYAKPSLKKCRPIAARNEDKKVFSGRL